MMLQMLGALLLAVLISTVFGKRFILWLEKRGIIQTLKKQVEEIVYTEKTKTPLPKTDSFQYFKRLTERE